MLSPKIVPYQPNAPVRSRRIDPKEWERLRPRLETLYIKDDKKLEEVMEIMALYDSFHASRRQYTQKFNEWGLCKNFPAKVMKSALRKRARAANNDLSIKYRGAAIAMENMDRWQQRVPNFNPLSSPTASTPSQMNWNSPHVVTSEQRVDARQSSTAKSPPINVSDDESADVDDDVISTAYDEIRRSISPQVAEYIFQPRENGSLSTMNNSAWVGWTLDGILSISVTEPELRKLSLESVQNLERLSANLLSVGGKRYLNYCAHIDEVLFARDSLVSLVAKDVQVRRINLARSYLHTDRMTDCESLLMGAIAKIDSLRPGDPWTYEFRLVLGQVRSRQGQLKLAEELCTQAVTSLRSTLGLAHCMTWKAYETLSRVLENHGRYEEARRLRMGFYVDVYRTVSTQLMPGLISSLELCRDYIKGWMSEPKLQRLVRAHFVDEIPLGISERITIILTTVIVEKAKEEWVRGTFPRIVEDLLETIGLIRVNVFRVFASLIAFRIQAVRHLGSDSLRKEALRIVEDLGSTKVFVPLWIFAFHNEGRVGLDRMKEEQDLIRSLENVFNSKGHPSGTASFRLSEDEESSVSTLAIAKSPKTHQSDFINGSQTSIITTTAPGQASFAEASIHTFGLDIGTAIPSAGSLTTFVPPRPHFTSVSTESLALTSFDHIGAVASPPVLPWSAGPSLYQPWSPAPEGQLWSDGRPNNRFSPTMMDTTTPPFTFSLPQTPQASRMFPPPSPAQASPAALPSSVLIGHPDFSASPKFFELPQSPLPPSSFYTSDSSPMS